jgi:hypothetical protein
MFTRFSHSGRLAPKAFRILAAAFLLVFGVVAPRAAAQSAQSWPPVTSEELALKESPLSLGEPALILNYEVQTDNVNSTESIYLRIKIFREEGRKYADVGIPYFENQTQVEEIRARVISPDGKSEDFSGTIFDREVVRMKKFRWNTKAFTLSNVQVGSIIEYSYRLRDHNKIPGVFRNPYDIRFQGAYAFPAAEWTIQRALSVRHAHFEVHPINGARTLTFSHELPKDAIKQTLEDGTFEIDVSNIPAFVNEDYSPPEESLKVRADVFYTLGMFNADPGYYWGSLARRDAEFYDGFIGRHKSLQKEADRLISPADSDDAKLKKVYARVQQIRALTYEPEKSRKEQKQQGLKENKNVEDVLNRGYAYGSEINLVFIALARAAGFRAYPVRVTARDRSFFTQERLDPNQLNALVVKVIVGSSSRFFDPATRYCPYGLLPWEETHAGGILIDTLNGQIGNTPDPESKDAVTRRHAELKLDAEGNLEGDVSIVYEGQEALTRRLNAIDQDEAQRRKNLEETVQKSLPQGAVVKLLSSDAWTTSEAPLKTQFHLQVPHYATQAGQRLVLPLAVFHSNAQNPFASANRIHAVYFEFPAEVYDEVKIDLPAGVEIESVPHNQKIEAGTAHYELMLAREANSLGVNRQFKIASYFVPVDRYPALRRFYENVHANDDQQAVLKPAQSAVKN